MQYLCQNGEDYDECGEIVEIKNSVCSDCTEKSYETYLENFYGGISPMTENERQSELEKKLKDIK